MKRAPSTTATPQIRVAIYCRQSVASDLEFGSIDAQREAVENYVASQRGEGWVALPNRYDDAGFSGGNIDRPSFQRLMNDINAGRVDVVAIYKLDRLSRSLLDFAQIVDSLQKRGVALVSVTQQFSTASSMGKLTLNILMSFAEFERQVISERTKDKIVASRRRGLWTGGVVPLGYRVHEKNLVVDEVAAETVQSAFRIYLERASLLDTLAELDRRCLRGRTINGTPSAFNKSTLRSMLSNPIYLGQVRAGEDLVAGRHEAIVDRALWDEVQRVLRNNVRPMRGKPGRWGAILSGLLMCATCGSPMTHEATLRRGRAHRYYVCQLKQKQGADACPGSRAPAGELEEVVLNQIRGIGADPEVLLATVTAAHRQRATHRPELVAEVRRLTNDRTVLASQRTNLLDALQNGGTATASIAGRITEVDEQIARLQARLDEVAAQLAGIETGTIDEAGIRDALAKFTPVWDSLESRERQRVLHLLVETVKFDAEAGEVTIEFRDTGIAVLQREVAARRPA